MSDYLLRIDIDNHRANQPKLVGVAMTGFGWLIGGGSGGSLSIAVEFDGTWRPFDNTNTQDEVDRFKSRVRNFDWYKNGSRNWPTV